MMIKKEVTELYHNSPDFIAVSEQTVRGTAYQTKTIPGRPAFSNATASMRGPEHYFYVVGPILLAKFNGR
jgi:hypothetical protein